MEPNYGQMDPNQQPIDPNQQPLDYNVNFGAMGQPAPQPWVPPQPDQSMGTIGAGPAIPNPAAMISLLDNPAGQALVGAGVEAISKNVGGLFSLARLDRLKYYFNVSNTYVVSKLKVLLLPCLHKDWKRRLDGQNPNENVIMDPQPAKEPTYVPPRGDVNAPDLYIPSMAFITYLLMMGFVLGSAGQFSPEVITINASSTLVTLFLEVLFFRVGFYFFFAEVAAPNLFDLVAWSGYKYVGLIVSLVIGWCLGSWSFFLCKLAMGGSMALFVMKTMANTMGRGVIDQSNTGLSRRNLFLIVVGVIQIILAFLLLRGVPVSKLVTPARVVTDA